MLKEFASLKLSDFTVVATLGVGGFGRVELVRNHNTIITLKQSLMGVDRQHSWEVS